MNRYIHSPDSGFTLHELLFTLAIVAILVALSLPPMSRQVSQLRIRVVMKHFMTAIETARAVAISNNTTITFCRSKDGQTCSGLWHEGAIVFTDDNKDHIINDDDQLLLKLESSPAERILWRAFGNRQYIQVSPRGFIYFQSGNFTFCPLNKDASLAGHLVLNSMGRMRISTDSDHDGIVENAKGDPVSC